MKKSELSLGLGMRALGVFLFTLIILIGSFEWPSSNTPAHAATITYIQSAKASNSGGLNNLAVPFTSANTAGNLIIATVSFDTGSTQTWSCSDSQGNPYTTATSLNDSRHGQLLGICYAANIKAGANTVTVSFGTSVCCRRMTIQEYAGVEPVSPLDKVAIGTGAGTAAASPSVTPSQTNELIFGVVDCDGTCTGTIAAAGGFALRQNAAEFASEDLVQATIAPITSSFTISASRDYIAAIVAFKSGSGAPPPPDTTPPTVSVTTPTNNATVFGTATTVSATASDNVGVVGVQFLLDGANLGTEDTTSPYSITWNTTTAISGAHILSARARDAATNATFATDVNVTVDNQAPTGTIVINGGATATNSRNATLTLSAADALGTVTQMRISNTTTAGTAETYATTRAWTLTNSAGTKTVYVQYKDASGNWSGNFSDTIVYDTTAPTISGVGSSNINSNGGNINWTTNEAATSQVEYGLTTSYGTLTTIDSSLVTAHTISLTGLNANTTYNYRVRSKDIAGNEKIGNNTTFKTLAGPDITPPSIPTNLAATAISSSQINLTWTASTDNIGVTGYKIFRNSVQIATSAVNSYSNTGLSAATLYSYSVLAYDAAGNNSNQSATASATTNSLGTGFGVIGDSTSDEYQADDNRGAPYGSTTLGWVEQLAITRGVDFGSWGTRPSPRRTGYANNWALSGTDASGAIQQAQGLATQISQGVVSNVIAIACGKDFTDQTVYGSIYDGSMSQAQLDQKVNQIISDFTTIITTLQNAGNIRIIASNCPDPSNYSVYQSVFPNSAGRQRVTTAVNQANNGIAALYIQKNVALFDYNAYANSIYDLMNTQQFISVGAEQIELNQSGNEPHHFVLADGHFGTVASGFLANAIMTGFASYYSLPYTPFTDQELLQQAGLIVSPPDTTPPSISISSPADNSTVSGTISITTSNVSDNVGVAGVTFLVDGNIIGSEDTTSPYIMSLDTNSLTNASHVLTATARDAAGNSTTSTPVTVTVNNFVPPPNILPVGNFDEIRSSDGAIRAWTYDPDLTSTSIPVQIFFNGPVGTGSLVYSANTDVLRADVNTTFSITGNHGVEWIIPSQYRDGQNHSVYIYGIDANNSSVSTLLSGSPLNFNLTAPTGPVAFPLKLSTNSRYLMDQNNVPFPILGRTSWFVISLSAANYQTYINDSVSRGYNAIEMHVLNHDDRGNNEPFAGNGSAPFLKRLDSSNWDGTLGGSAADFTTPNETYWSYVDAFLNYAESQGVAVLMFPAYTGYDGGSQGWMQEMVANGQTKMNTYGTYLANRYKNQKNIIWMMGGDHGTPPNSFTTAQTNAESGLLTGLKSVAGQQSIFFSAEWTFESIATDQTTFGSSMSLNGVYSFSGDVNTHGRRAYSFSPVEPAFLLEEPYDQEGSDGVSYNLAATQPTRRFQWWGWLSTIGGYVSGNGYVWPFNSPDWQNHLDVQGSRDMGRLNAFIKSVDWSSLVPSGLNGMKTLLTAGNGAVSSDTYVAASANPAGTLMVAYVPPAHTGSITVDMTAMSGTTTARWFNPTTAVYTTISGSPFANTGTRVFTPPGNNGTGYNDWALVLTSTTDSSAPSIPTNLSATAVSASQINLAWTASNDNVAVTGYKIFRNGAQINTSATTSYSDLGLTANTTYSYTVSAFDAASNNSAQSTASQATTQAATGPITVPLINSTVNPNYFVDNTGKAVLLTGSQTWNTFQDHGTNGTPQSLDFPAFVNFLTAHNHNFTLLWNVELPKYCGFPSTSSSPPDFTVDIQPWLRTGPGVASDGKPKFDLTQFNQAYFDRLRSRVQQLNTAGVYAGVYTFTAEYLSAYPCASDGYPFNGINNINSISSSETGSVTMTAVNSVTNIQDLFVEKVVDTLNDLPNVLWAVSEEAPLGSDWWNAHQISHLKAYEATKPLHHPVGFPTINVSAPNDNGLYNSNADWVAPAASVSPTTSCGTGTPTCKVNINDSDHSAFGMWNNSAQSNRNFFWQNFMTGNQSVFMDPYVIYYPRENRNLCVSPVNGICSAPDPRWENVRNNMGYTRTYANRMNLIAMHPEGNLSSTGYALANTAVSATEFLVYSPNGGSFNVNLSNTTRTLNVEWFNPATGQTTVASPVVAGFSTSFNPPFSGDAVLYIYDPAPGGDTTNPTTPTNLVATGLSSSQIGLTWTASTDNIGVTGYKIYRNSVQVGTSATTSYTDSNLAASTTYTYNVAAYDSANNNSLLSSAASGTTSAGAYVPVYPIKASTNNRYLVDQNNVPFLLVADSEHTLTSKLTASEITTYLVNRKTRGFNAVNLNAVCSNLRTCPTNAAAQNGALPFTSGNSPSTYDLATPNPAYWSQVDTMIQTAATNGLVVMLNPLELSFLITLQNNGLTKAFNYGAFVGNRYKNNTNIIWLTGEDFVTWQTQSDLNLMAQMMAGIKSADPGHLQTIELSYSYSYSNQATATLAPYLGLDLAYTYYDTYDYVLRAYNSAPTLPVFMGEANYEGENNTGALSGPAGPLVIRKQAWWTMTSGGAGHLFGNGEVNHSDVTWQSKLNTQATLELPYLPALFNNYQWWNMIPDQTHQVVTAGFGTYNSFSSNITTSNYATTSWITDGTLSFTYAPAVTTLTVAMNKFAGPVTARWYDPSHGTYQSISGSPFANSGTRQFATPGSNGDGDPDWVLVLEASLVPDTTVPTVPTNLITTPVSQTQINLTWTASTDNIAVSGYKVFRNGIQIATPNTNSYSDTGLTPATTYSYTVSAYDAANNNSTQSTAVNGTTLAPDTTAPSVPTNLSSSNVTSSTATISWTASTDNVAVTGYKVYRNGIQIGTTASTSYPDSGLTAATTYSYTVSAYDAANNNSTSSTNLLITTTNTPPATPAFVKLKETAVAANNNTASTGAFTSAVTSGNLMAVWLWYNSSTQSVSSVTDTVGNVYAKAVGPTTGTGSGASWRQEIWYAKNITGGTNLNVTATFTGTFNAEKSITAHEYSGLDTVSPLDVTAAAATTVANASSGTVTTHFASELIFGAIWYQNSGSQGSGFTRRSSLASNATEDKVVSTIGSYAATFTNSAQAAIVQMVAFKAAGQ